MNICLIGGDKRYLYLIDLLKSCDKINNLNHFGFSKINSKNESINDLFKMIKKSDVIIFPAPISVDNFINMPLSDIKIPINSDLLNACKNKYILCGFPEKLFKISNEWDTPFVIDYFSDESLLIKNAFLTSEAAIISSYKYINIPLNKSKILICGFGRIGKSLAFMLKGLGSSVTISARKDKDITWINCLNFNSIKTSNIHSIISSYDFDIIYNTIPQTIFDEKTISNIKGSPIIIDLASLPGGIDLNTANKYNIKAYRELALPGKYFPIESANIIKDSIVNILNNKLR